MNGPVAVMIVVSSEPSPVLKRAGVKDNGAPVSCWNCATCDGVRPRRRGCGLLSFANAFSKPSLPSFLPSFWRASISRRNIETDDRVAKCRQSGLCVDPQAVEHANVTLVGGDSNVALLGRGSCREVILAGVLLQLAVDELVARQARINAVEGVPGQTQEGLLIGGLSELVFGCEDIDRNIVVHLPLVHHLASLEVHAIDAMGIIWILQYHVVIASVEHDLAGRESLALERGDIVDARAELKLIVIRVLEDANLVSAHHERPVDRGTNSKLAVHFAILVQVDHLILVFILVVVGFRFAVDGVLEVFLVVIFLCSLALTFIVTSIFKQQVAEGIEHVVTLGILHSLVPLCLIEMLPQCLHESFLETLHDLALWELQQPGVG
ncbi:hypothetical protein AC579_189 [Pseudocercospora musae]|uniref:Uncharacterized protein n=1 Tax=Pseudocercospora musae TaxID=113226 RepID=A0A139HYI1_9PEZI|nr:hypothetical protein AC579_189 [Pseudocercospora musae]